jgi:hypothetical protein
MMSVYVTPKSKNKSLLTKIAMKTNSEKGKEIRLKTAEKDELSESIRFMLEHFDKFLVAWNRTVREDHWVLTAAYIFW